ncbi:MAG: DUF1800 domain-containing protein [Burkholderiaceae bacterium]
MNRHPSIRLRIARILAMAITVSLAACGGSGGDGLIAYKSGGGTAVPPQSHPVSDAEASRFLSQATFGPKAVEVDDLRRDGYVAWIEKQFSLPVSSLRDWVDGRLVLSGQENIDRKWIQNGFWRNAAVGSDQLRQRVAFALSQIFVVSMMDGNVNRYPRGVADYYDRLARNAFGNFRTLLQEVSLHPMMGLYLSHLANQRADPQTGRVPDENFARELMQLFTIGLYELNVDGTMKTDAMGEPIETYTNADVEGLARVFTGFGWAGPDRQRGRFFGWIGDDDREVLPMQGYPDYHATEEKSFLGLTLPAQTFADPEQSLSRALDHIFAHPNVGPFIAKQLIQRLVTSNPSPAYVARVAAEFADNGEGTRGDMRAVIRAILFDPEARDGTRAMLAGSGRVREPILRFAHWMRSFDADSESRQFLIGVTDDPAKSLGQSVLRSPSVFNFYRPGYVPPNTDLATNGLVAPELQTTHETSVAGWLNMMRQVVAQGYGESRDVRSAYGRELALAMNPAELVERINVLLLNGSMSGTLRARLQQAVESVNIPSNDPARADQARLSRVHMAVFLAIASPEYAVLK